MDKEINKSLLTFPCAFTIKVIGADTEAFEIAVATIIGKHTSPHSQTDTQPRKSAHGKYLALSVTIYAESKTQLDAIYQELCSSPHVIMAL